MLWALCVVRQLLIQRSLVFTLLLRVVCEILVCVRIYEIGLGLVNVVRLIVCPRDWTGCASRWHILHQPGLVSLAYAARAILARKLLGHRIR